MKNTKKNIIPVIAVLVLIVIIILFMLLGRLIEKYTPSKEHQELSEYYGLASDDSVALIFNNEVLSVQGRLIDGNPGSSTHPEEPSMIRRPYCMPGKKARSAN